MKEKIKKVWSEHKTEIIVGAVVVGGVICAIVAKKHIVNFKGMKVIGWDPNQKDAGLMTLEEIKRILDLNANNTASFAIFREGLDPNAFACIKFDSNLII